MSARAYVLAAGLALLVSGALLASSAAGQVTLVVSQNATPAFQAPDTYIDYWDTSDGQTYWHTGGLYRRITRGLFRYDLRRRKQITQALWVEMPI